MVGLDGDEGEESLRPAVEEEQVKAVAKAIVARGKARRRPWTPGRTLDFDAISWQPNLERRKPKTVLHIHMADRLRSHVITRMRAARDAGYEAHIACYLDSLYDEDALVQLAALDASIHLVNQDSRVGEATPLLKVLAQNRVRVSPNIRKQLGLLGWKLSQEDAPKQRKGRRFEAVLVFLLSQIEDFEIAEINLRTATEELDIVVQQRATQGRCWATLGAPFIMVEAKNWKADVDQPQVSIFRTKMQGRRQTVRVGIMFSASDYTVDAKNQELRFASENLTIAFLTGKDIEAWIDAADGDGFLEDLIRSAMLR